MELTTLLLFPLDARDELRTWRILLYYSLMNELLRAEKNKSRISQLF
jgi:tRNA A22 N-methylase